MQRILHAIHKAQSLVTRAKLTCVVVESNGRVPALAIGPDLAVTFLTSVALYAAHVGS